MGLTDKQAYQQLAAEYQHDCIISDKVRIQAAANQQVVQNMRQGLEVQRQGIIQQQSRLTGSIASFPATGGTRSISGLSVSRLDGAIVASFIRSRDAISDNTRTNREQ